MALTVAALCGLATEALAQNQLPASGLFHPFQSVAVAGLDPVATAIGDLNGDGRQDVVVVGAALNGGSAISVFLQTPSGTLGPPVPYPATAQAHSVALGDLDGDGRLDVAVSTSSSIGVLRQTGSGTLLPMVEYPIPVPVALLLRTGDVNNDGRTDLIAIRIGADRDLIVYLQNASGTLNAPILHEFDHFGRDLGVADVTGDGRDDIVVTGRSDHAFWVMAQDDAGGLRPPIPYDLGPERTTKDLALADVTGDSHRDVVVTYEPGNGSGIAVFGGSASGGFDPPMEIPCTNDQPCSGGQEIVEAGDLDGDGRADLLTIGTTGFELRTYLQGIDGGPPDARGDPLPFISRANVQSAAVGDLDGDGLTDVAVVDNNSKALIVFYRTPCRELLQDGSFEKGIPNPLWLEYSSHFGTPLCRADLCGTGGGTAGPRLGAIWAWFGGVEGEGELGAIAQDFTLPAGESATLRFHLWNGLSSGNGTDLVRALIDATPVFSTLEGNPGYTAGYALATADLRPFADGGVHRLTLDSYTTGSKVTNFSVDDVSVEVCRPQNLVDVAETTLAEGDSGTRSAVLTVSLAAPSTDTVFVDWSTADGTAQAGKDYVPSSGTLVFAPGSTTATLAVSVLGDRLFEGNERFFVNLSEPRLAFVRRGRAAVTIVDDDAAGLMIDDVAVTAPFAGTAPARFTVTLAPPSPSTTVSAHYATANGTAVAGVDYDATSGVVSFPAGALTAPISVDVRPSLDGVEKAFVVNLSGASGAPIANATGTATIHAPGFHTLAPCRLFDSRRPVDRPALAPGATRALRTTLACDIPNTARAVSLNVTATGATTAGHLRLFPPGASIPTVSTINYGVGETRANNAIVRLNDEGRFAVFCGQGSGTVHLIVDVNGYFTSP